MFSKKEEFIVKLNLEKSELEAKVKKEWSNKNVIYKWPTQTNLIIRILSPNFKKCLPQIIVIPRQLLNKLIKS